MVSDYPLRVAGFERVPFDRVLHLADPGLHARCAGLAADADARSRARLAHDLNRGVGRYLTDLGVYRGPAYTVWRRGAALFLSMLPGEFSVQPQRTIEMHLEPDRIRLVAVWTAQDEMWSSISVEEYRQSLGGLLADEAGLDLGREASLKVLIDRGARFDFPVAPGPGPAEPLCSWRREEPADPGFGWDRNPLLIDPTIDSLYPVHHSATRVAVGCYRVRGSWSDDALHTLHEAFAAVLPGRHVIRVLEHGCRRLVIYLGIVNAVPSQQRARSDREDSANVLPALDLAAAGLARMVARQRGVPIDPPAVALDAPQPWAAEAFAAAERSIGRAEFPPAVDSAKNPAGTAEWTTLRQVTRYDDMPERFFSLDAVRSDLDLLDYVWLREQPPRT